MPVDMRLHARTECPVEDTPPSTRPSSAASSVPSSSSTPHRSTSMDSLNTNSSTSEKPSGEEYIPTRIIRSAPKANLNAMQFVKTGPAILHKSAREQMKKAEVVKSLRKTSLQEEEEWQTTSPSSTVKTIEDGPDWQMNLDKWKSSRRKRNEDILERVIEVKKYSELDDDFSKMRRKSKTFSEMREETTKKGRRYNLVVHDDDNNDLSGLGLGGKSESSEPSDNGDHHHHQHHHHHHHHHQHLEHDNKDTKSDAGFCTGSDTGSDGVFAEDNISDTSSALGDKKDAHDSLLDTGSTNIQKESEVFTNGHTNSASNSDKSSSNFISSNEYTYDKAIEDYKHFAENTVKKRTPSVTSLSSNASASKEEDKFPYRSQSPSKKIDDKLMYFHKEMEKDHVAVNEPRFIRREKALKVDINKRRSMFELRDIDSQDTKHTHRRSFDVSNSLRNKVASFENINDSENRAKGITPPRDTKFKEKLASFSQKEKSNFPISLQKKTPERDQNFYQKLENFTKMENQEIPRKSPERKPLDWRSSLDRKSPESKYSERRFTSLNSLERKTELYTNISERNYLNRVSPERKPRELTSRTQERLLYDKKPIPSSTPLKDRIASFENLSPVEDSFRNREKSVSMECLNKPNSSDISPSLNSSVSVTNLFRRTPSTPYMVVEVDESYEPEQTCVRRSVSRVSQCSETSQKPGSSGTSYDNQNTKRITIHEDIQKTEIQRDLSAAPIYSIFKYAEFEDYLLNTSSVVNGSSEQSKECNYQNERKPAIQTPEMVPQIPTSLPPVSFPKTTPPESKPLQIPMQVPLQVPPQASHEAPPQAPPELPPEAPPQLPPRDPPPPVPKSFNISPAINIATSEPRFGINAPVVSSECHRSKVETELQEIEAYVQQENLLGHYGDEDIDEVMDNYESITDLGVAEDLSSNHIYEKASEMTTLLNHNSNLIEHNPEENVYEKIADEEPMYENIYEKLPETDEDELPEEQINDEGDDSPLDHQYQTLDEVKYEIKNLSPALPPKNRKYDVIEVLDVTWTEDYSTPAAPPSIPPPPPPPDEEDQDEETEGEGALPSLPQTTAPIEEREERLEKPSVSPQTTKQEIRKKMSDFLGTNPHVEEELTMQPPPDVNEILRQEREAERLIVQKQANLARESSVLDFDSFKTNSYRPKYTWEDRMRADDSKPNDLDESSDHLEFHTKLAELEQEMEKHDRDMLQRVKAPIVNEVQDYPLSPINTLTSTLQTESKNNKSVYEERHTESNITSTVFKPSHNSNVPAATSSTPATLPIQEFYTAPAFDSYTTSTKPENLQTGNTRENIQYNKSSAKSITAQRVENGLEVSQSSALDQQPRKQSILALSAIPKPRLVDNDSWIMKKKADASKKDYSKHWLIQEAEQRRLEQQDKITRQNQKETAMIGLVNKSDISYAPTPTTSYQNYYQSTNSSFSQQQPVTNNISCNTNFNGSNSSLNVNASLNAYIPQSPSKQTSITPSNNSSFMPNTSNSNNNRKKQTMTYQPPLPSPQSTSNKPLPESIINTITQRVNNKNKLNGSRPAVYNSSYRSDDNYHDYMNTDSFNPTYPNISPNRNSPPVSQGGIVPPVLPSPTTEDQQRLLSVSGKKKCSHCGEELGRGAAMIIESLRLFYHIPCFKCCVCGIQLGNGTSGADVRVRNHKLHCHNCYSNDEGMKFSKV